MAKQDTKTAPEAPAPETPPEALAPETTSNLKVRGVYKRMVDPHTGLAYEMAPTEVYKLTPWVQDQIDSGKLLVC